MESIPGLLQSLKIPSPLRTGNTVLTVYFNREQRKCINIAAFACSLPKPEANQGVNILRVMYSGFRFLLGERIF